MMNDKRAKLCGVARLSSSDCEIVDVREKTG